MTTGSSNATAYTAGAIALLWSLYPDATSGQVLQALIHTTDGRVNDTPTHDAAWGYGTVSPRALLSVDPTTYPDENPFLLDDPGAVPSIAQVLATTAEPSSAASTENSAQGDAAPEESAAAPQTPWATIIGGFVAIVVVGTVVLAVVRARRRPHEPGHHPDHDSRGARG
jgi:hypothetical protein